MSVGGSMDDMHAMRLPTRSAEPGAALEMMVLAELPEGCAAVDLSSGSLVRARYGDRPATVLRPFEVVTATLADDPDGPDPTQPEAVVLTGAPTPTGRLRGRTVRRLLAPLLLPDASEPFGFPGSAAPYWTVPGDRPSLCVLRPASDPYLVRHQTGGVFCRFAWRGVELELPVLSRSLRRALAEREWSQLSGRSLQGLVGYEPHHLVLSLTAPRSGRCYKVLSGFLPRS